MTKEDLYRIFGINDIIKLPDAVMDVLMGDKSNRNRIYEELIVDVKTASVLLGHADVTTTMNIYVHPTDDAKRNAVKSGLKAFFK